MCSNFSEFFKLPLKAQSIARDSGISAIINPTSRRHFLDLESELERESNFVLEHSLDRLRIRYQTDEFDFNLGRQAVSWGTGLIWNPTDLFSGFAPTEIDRDEKSGIDAGRVIWTPDEMLSLDLIAEPQNEEKSYSINKQDSALAIRGASHIGEYDISLLGGFIGSD